MKLTSAILSGFFAALAGACGKFAFDDSFDPLVRTLLLVGLVLCNALMLKYFVEALREAGSVVGTTVNACANVAFSAILGASVFGESNKLTPKWFAGACLALSGIYCINRGTQTEQGASSQEHEKQE